MLISGNTLWSALAFAIGFAALTIPSTAQELDCSDTSNMTQMKMNACAYQAFQAADGNLNDTYRLAKEFAKDWDSNGTDEIDRVLLLRDAQRAWIKFRDLACELEGSTSEGGSIQPLIIASCKERLTRQRTEDLRLFSEVN